MLESLKNALKVSELKNKLLYTIAIMFVFRLAAHIPVPGVDRSMFEQLASNNALLGFFDVVSGGAFKNVSVVAMGIFPYINASIIMQLLTIVIPHLEQLSKEGEEGRKQITQYTRYFTAVLGMIQSIGLAVYMRNSLDNPGIAGMAVVVITMTAGTVFLMWLGEQITEKGIGNGISLIIFAGIVSSIPSALVNVGELLKAGTINLLSVLLLIVIAGVVIAGIVIVQQGQRRIPVQYAKRVVGRRVYGGQTTHLPLRVNQAGVIPVIFASSLLMFPQQLIQWFAGTNVGAWYEKYLGWGTAANTIVYALLIIGFTYFYTAVIMNPVDMADNIKKYGGFIPGIRPGRPTAEYISKVMTRITMVGAIFLAFIAILPNFVLAATKIPGIWFGGTSLLIVVGVALDTMKQIESQLLMRSYQGFIK